MFLFSTHMLEKQRQQKTGEGAVLGVREQWNSGKCQWGCKMYSHFGQQSGSCL